MNEEIKIIASGDSWFDYPWFLWTGGGIPPHISRLLGIPIQNFAHHGYGTEEMLSLRKRKELEYALPDADILLFSGGGNDIAGDQFCLWLNDNENNNIDKAIAWDRLDKALDLVMADYEDLVNIVNDVSPDCVIVTHEYDFPPSIKFGKGVCFQGPWLQPSLSYCGWTDPEMQSAIVKMALRELARRLRAWAEKDPAHRIHIQTQGLLRPTDWGNEMHPNRSGFRKAAEAFHVKLEPLVHQILKKGCCALHHSS